ncbi:MAG: SGNH/GDSL hydrolase family protein [Sedimentisphaerales bacterium]|nr:SGNH/GDSL hydrolase family protein [Sedimentisphaerales bacterium]
MTSGCKIFNTIERIKAASYCNIVYMGGSLTTAAGAGDSAVTSWRRLFTRYIYDHYHKVYHCQPSEVMAGIGAMESYGAVFTIERNVTPHLPVLAFVEFCVNDRLGANKDLVCKGVEGIVRQIKSGKTRPDVVLLGGGCRPGSADTANGLIDHSIHREIAEYYGLAFIDIQDYMHKTLEARGQSWDDVSIIFEENDSLHLNDYGNLLWFECMRDWFEQEWQEYERNHAERPNGQLAEPLYSDEFEHTKLIDPTKKNKQINLEGNWEKQDGGVVPWYFDNVLVGRPGDKLTFTFEGTAIGAICLVNCNGLKIEARLDGRDIAGPYTNFGVEFGKFFMLEHGMEDGEHVLELEVGQPMTRRNRLEDPKAQIGYLTVASRH